MNVTRSEALRVAREILAQAESERLQAAEKGAGAGMSSDDEPLDTLLRDIGRAAVARQNAGKFPIDQELWSQGAKRLQFLYAKLTPDQIAACVEWARKQVKE